MTISAGRNKIPQKIKYIVLIILTSLATLFFERVIEVIRTFNPYYDTEKVVEHAIDFIVNGKFRNSSDAIFFTTKVNGDIPHYWKICIMLKKEWNMRNLLK